MKFLFGFGMGMMLSSFHMCNIVLVLRVNVSIIVVRQAKEDLDVLGV